MSALSTVETPGEVLASLEAFNQYASENAERSRSILRSTWYWVYDPEADQFGPGKFVGYSGMTFDLYEEGNKGTTSGAKFDGHVSKSAIEQVLSASFEPNTALHDSLTEWGTSLLGKDAFGAADSSKWRFVVLDMATAEEGNVDDGEPKAPKETGVRKGYLLACESGWLSFHIANSVGGSVVYCRGTGAPVRTLYPGDPVFCIQSGEKQHHIRMWGYFAWYEQLPIANGWAKFGKSLGAATEDGWQHLVSVLPSLKGKTEFGAIVLQDMVVPETPLPIESVSVGLRKSPKGRGLLSEEVERIFKVLAGPKLQVTTYVPTGTDTRERVNRDILARMGQAAFRQEAIRRYGARCMVSGCELAEIIEAAHIRPYRGEADHHPENALLLRSDLHTLFDLDLLGINPKDLTVHLHQKVREAGYESFDGTELKLTVSLRPSAAALALRWKDFKQRGKAPQQVEV